MKEVSEREFYENSRLVDELPAGEEILVISQGIAKFTVKRVPAPTMTRQLAEERSIGSPETEIDGTAFLRSLKK
jgi:hypothetical protein